MKFFQRHSIEISILIAFSLIVSGCRTSQPTITSAPRTTEIETLPPSQSFTNSPTSTQPAATDTPHPPTKTATQTETSTSTPSPTNDPPSMIVNEDATCREGPGLIYNITAYLSKGAVPIVLGQDKESTWWSIEEPIFNTRCWVSAEIVSVEGNTDSLAIFTPIPTPTLEPTPTPKEKGVFYYLVAMDTGGRLGCGDSLIPVYAGIPTSGDLETDIHNALHALLKLKVKEVGNYYNPLHNAHLSTAGVTFHKDSGNVVVNLSGSIPKPKDICEYDRVRGVLWETVRHYPRVKGVTFWIGNKLIGDLIAIIDR